MRGLPYRNDLWRYLSLRLCKTYEKRSLISGMVCVEGISSYLSRSSPSASKPQAMAKLDFPTFWLPRSFAVFSFSDSSPNS